MELTRTLGPYTSDTTGGVGGIEFTPEVTGNYTVQAFYKGQTISGTVSGTTLSYNILPTQSEAVTFEVQQDPIQGNPIVPLPTEYWSRPIYATNYQWAQLGGNWWGLGKPSFTDTGGYDAQGNNFNPYTKRQTQLTLCGLNQQLSVAKLVYQSAVTKKANTLQPQFSTDNSNQSSSME